MVERFLHKKEELVHEFTDLDVPLYLTTKRIILLETGWLTYSFQDMSLKHLSSIDGIVRIKTDYIIAGILLFIVGGFVLPYIFPQLYTQSYFGQNFYWISLILMILGIISMVYGVFFGQKEVIFYADSGDRITVSVKNRETIEKIIKTVRENE